MNPVIADQIAVMKVRAYLAGLRGYPFHKEGESLLARTIQECAVSLAHADAILETFDNLCPTPREIKDVAFNLRSRFEPKPKSDIEKWKEEGATYDPTFYSKLITEFKDRHNYDAELWRAIKGRFFFPDPNKSNPPRRIVDKDTPKLSWGFLKSCKRLLGFPLNAYETRIAEEWDRDHGLPQSMPQRNPITQADIDREKQKSNNNGGVA